MKQKTITVRVTKADIKNGLPMKCEHCPIARALTRRLKVPTHFDGEDMYSPLVSESNSHVRLPKRCENFANRFDCGKPVKPFKFKFKIPKKTWRLIPV